MDQAFISNANHLLGNVWTFVKDIAGVHGSNLTKSWLVANEVHVLQRPSNSADLKIIENIWGQKARKIYAHKRQYLSVSGLSNAFQIA